MQERSYYLKPGWKILFISLWTLLSGITLCVLYGAIEVIQEPRHSEWVYLVVLVFGLLSIICARTLYASLFKPFVVLTEQSVELPSLRFLTKRRLDAGTWWINYSDIGRVTEGKTFGVFFKRYHSHSRAVPMALPQYPTKGITIYNTIQNAQECYDTIAARMKGKIA